MGVFYLIRVYIFIRVFIFSFLIAYLLSLFFSHSFYLSGIEFLVQTIFPEQFPQPTSTHNPWTYFEQTIFSLIFPSVACARKTRLSASTDFVHFAVISFTFRTLRTK